MNIGELKRYLNECDAMDEDILDVALRRHADGTICKARSAETCPFNKRAEKGDMLNRGGDSESKIPSGISVEAADITKFDGDAVINAGNRWMKQGGGLDGAMHRAAGPSLIEQCDKIPADENGFKIGTGECKVLDAGNMPSKKVLYTVGPDCRQYTTPPEGVERDGFGNYAYRPDWNTVSDENKAIIRNDLRKAYKSCFDAADENGLKNIAAPALSMGIFGVPPEEVASAFAEESRKFVEKGEGRKVKMCLGGADPKQVENTVALFKNSF